MEDKERRQQRMCDKQPSFGEFFDAVMQTEDAVAKIFMKEWIKLVSPSKWEEAIAMPLSLGLALAFAEDMATYYQRDIGMLESPLLYADAIREGHEFLREIHSKMREFGIEVDIKRIDVPLSFSDAMGIV